VLSGVGARAFGPEGDPEPIRQRLSQEHYSTLPCLEERLGLTRLRVVKDACTLRMRQCGRMVLQTPVIAPLDIPIRNMMTTRQHALSNAADICSRRVQADVDEVDHITGRQRALHSFERAETRECRLQREISSLGYLAGDFGERTRPAASAAFAGLPGLSCCASISALMNGMVRSAGSFSAKDVFPEPFGPAKT